MTAAVATPRVAIIGGGFTGSAIAVHLARQAIAPLAITIFEPRASLGGGVAYSSRDPAHRTNVAATRMSLYSHDERHFERWLVANDSLRDDPEARLADGRIYVRRETFGAYVAAELEAAADGAFATVRHLQERAVAVRKHGPGWRITSESGRAVAADIVVLAVSHPPPAPSPQLVATFGAMPGFVPDPWSSDALERIGADDDVLVMGTALSMADVVASLDRRGHRGKIVAFSRRGQISRPHAQQAHDAFGGFAERPPTTALELLVRLRAMLHDARAAGQPWQAVIDAARRDGQTVWRALDERQRRVLLRHLKPYWEVHRYRVAPQVGAVIERRRREGTLEIVAAALGEVAAEGQTMRCELRLRGRGGVSGGTRWVEAQALVVTTGPAHGGILGTNPALRSLAAAGLVQPDEHGLGVLVDLHHRTIARSGIAADTLLVAGPLARATFGELMGLPQVTRDAEAVAAGVLEMLAAGDRTGTTQAIPEARQILYKKDSYTRHLDSATITSIRRP